MSRAALMASCGDPFISMLSFRLFEERWQDEVDAFFINFNNYVGVSPEIAGEFIARVVQNPKVHVVYHPKGIGNGPPITEMVKIAKYDNLLLLEDDGFIFGKGAIDDGFKKIEADLCDAVGSPRFSCGNEVAEAAKKKYGLDYSGYGDVGPNYWPNFFFCKREHLLQTDLDFGSHAFKAGEYYPQLDHTFVETNYGDTFVWACVQLRALGVRFQSIPQHKASPFELDERASKTGNFWPDYPPMRWIHGGSLSVGIGQYLSGVKPDVSSDIAKQEIESRVAFWKLAFNSIDGFEPLRVAYRDGIENLVLDCNLDRDRITKKYNLYKELLSIE